MMHCQILSGLDQAQPAFATFAARLLAHMHASAAFDQAAFTVEDCAMIINNDTEAASVWGH